MGFRKELDFLKEAIKADFGTGNFDKLCIKAKKIDFKKLETVFLENSVSAFFYEMFIENVKKISAPEEFRVFLKSRAAKNAFINDILLCESVSVSKILMKNGIKHVFVKGPVLLKRVYVETWKREIADIDLLIFSETGESLEKSLEEAGFAVSEQRFEKIGKYKPDTEGKEISEVPFEKHGALCTITLDVHLSVQAHGIKKSKLNQIFPIHKINWEEEISSINVDGFELPCLSEEEEFLFEIFHFSIHHGFAGLKWFLDLGKYLKFKAVTLDWEKIFRIADNANLRKVLWTVIVLLEDFFDLKIPLKKKEIKFRIGYLEKKLYKMQIFRNPFSLRGRVGMKIAQTLLPVKLNQKIGIFAEIFFNPSSAYSIGGKENKFSILFPFRLLKEYIRLKNKETH